MLFAYICQRRRDIYICLDVAGKSKYSRTLGPTCPCHPLIKSLWKGSQEPGELPSFSSWICSFNIILGKFSAEKYTNKFSKMMIWVLGGSASVLQVGWWLLQCGVNHAFYTRGNFVCSGGWFWRWWKRLANITGQSKQCKTLRGLLSTICYPKACCIFILFASLSLLHPYPCCILICITSLS